MREQGYKLSVSSIQHRRSQHFNKVLENQYGIIMLALEWFKGLNSLLGYSAGRTLYETFDLNIIGDGHSKSSNLEHCLLRIIE